MSILCYSAFVLRLTCLKLRDSVSEEFGKILPYCFVFIYLDSVVFSENDHTSMTAPLPVCSAKLSMLRLGQYYGEVRLQSITDGSSATKSITKCYALPYYCDVVSLHITVLYIVLQYQSKAKYSFLANPVILFTSLLTHTSKSVHLPFYSRKLLGWHAQQAWNSKN